MANTTTNTQASEEQCCNYCDKKAEFTENVYGIYFWCLECEMQAWTEMMLDVTEWVEDEF